MQAGYRLAPRYTIKGEIKRLKAWQERATTDPTKLQELLLEATQTLQYFKDKGTATDEDCIRDFIVVPPIGKVIIDIDNKSGRDGSGNWEKLLDALDKDRVAPVLCVKTKTGGFHYYFDADAKYIKSVANFANYEGIDVRGQRGHVVLPYRVGPIESWQPGEYLLYKGVPSDPLTLLKITKLSVGFSDSEENLWLDEFRLRVGKLEPVDMIPAGKRDHLLWEASCIMYRKGVQRDVAETYMRTLADACEETVDLPRKKLYQLGKEKLDRIFKPDRKITTVQDLQRELALGGLVQVINDSATKYFFEHPNLFGFDPLALYSKEGMSDMLKGHKIITDDGEKTKITSGADIFKQYVPDRSVYGLGFYPDPSIKVYKDAFCNQTLYNSYEPPFLPDQVDELRRGAEDMFPLFLQFLQFLHPEKWEEILHRMAWSVQFPQFKPVSISVYVSKRHGIGKDILCDLHGILTGQKHYRRINSIDELTGKFMDLADALVVNIAEAQMGRGLAARNRIVELRGLIKTLVTSSSLKSERKNVQATWRQNFTTFIMTTNEFNPNMIEHGDRRHEIFLMPSDRELDQQKFGSLADLAHPSNYPVGKYPYDKLSTIWYGLKKLAIKKRYHIESASRDGDKLAIFSEGLSHLQAWLLTELPDVFSRDFITWFISKFYPQRDKLRPIDETEYFFRECAPYLKPVMNNKGVQPTRVSLTQLHRLVAGSDSGTLDLQKKRGVNRDKNYYQYLFTVRNHGMYDSCSSDEYNSLDEQIVKYYKDQSSMMPTNKTDDLDQLCTRFRMKAGSVGL